MNFSHLTLWCIACGLAIAAELATGTFYLLMIAFGLGIGALAAWLGFQEIVQVLLAAVVAGGATALLYWRRRHAPPPEPASTNRDVNLDIGERVTVSAWASDRTARIDYRGSRWSARLLPGAAPVPGVYVIQAMDGNWLVLAPL